jgi:hypothetical protein
MDNFIIYCSILSYISFKRGDEQKMKKIAIFVVIFFLTQIGFAGAISQSISLKNQNSNLCLIEDANYVILTTTELVDAVKDFKTWKEYPGFSVEIVTIQWISDKYNGRDLAEKIRNFLIDKYEEGNIDYLLIVGTRNNIPMRRCNPIAWGSYEYFYTDYYFSDITGNWDLDQDGKYAEYSDDEVDFTPEISVGRIPSDNKETVTQIFKNIMEYGSDTGSWKKNVLLIGAISYYEGLEAFGWIYERSDMATLMEECKVDIFEPEDFNCVRMYEAEGLRPSTYIYECPLEQSNVINEWKNNYGIVNMVGHSNENLASRWIWDWDDGDNIPEPGQGELSYKDILNKYDSDDLSMEKPPIVFSGGCSQLHGPNNMGRAFIEDSAAVAYIGSTDLGFYNITRVWNDENDGGFASMDYYFFYYLISQDQNCGDALSNSKLYFSNHFMFTEYNIEWIYRSYSTLMATTLYGDPALSLYPASNPPKKPITPEGPTSGRIKTEHTYTTSSNDPDEDQVRFLFDWGDGNTTITEYHLSGETISESYKWNKEGSFNIRVRAQDENGVWSDWSDSLSVSMPKSKSINFDFREIFNNIIHKLQSISKYLL